MADNPIVERGTYPGSTFGDRMRFLMWLSALRLGTWNGKEFAAKMNKLETQISKWVREDPKPGWEMIKSVAVPLGVSPTWLEDPSTPGAEEPALFAEWLDARRRWKAEQGTAATKADSKTPKKEPTANYTRVTSKDLAAKKRKKA